jgi:hypothetical protein
MERAVMAVKNKRLTVRAAAERYGVPRSTLQDKCKGIHEHRHGRPTVLSEAEESHLANNILLLSAEWGFPFSHVDLKHFIKSYLDRKGANTRFKNNLPTSRFVTSFLRRNPRLTLRRASLIKRARAAVSVEIITEFITNYSKSAEGVEPANIWNYDETCMRDDPGAKRSIFKKGAKYCEKVCNSSKSSTSVMFCGSATGEMLPPMVVYKAANKYSSWEERGPKGAFYWFSKSGWFDSVTFEKWFFQVFLKTVKRRPGVKLLIGDNLASHLSPVVIEACRENNILFVCFPPNSTDKLQPLDVSVFAALKQAWREILTEWKRRNQRLPSIPKTEFPQLLKQAIDKCRPGRHLPPGFEKCGLWPISLEKALSRLPKKRVVADDENDGMDDIRVMNATFEKTLEEMRGSAGNTRRPRGKKVAAGKSWTREETDSSDEADDVAGPSGDMGCRSDSEEEATRVRPRRDSESEEEVRPRILRNPRKVQKNAIESESESEEDEEGEELEEDDEEELIVVKNISVGQFVVAVYDGMCYIGQAEGEEPEDEVRGFTLIRYMERLGKNQFRWPTRADRLRTNNMDILLEVDPPIPVVSDRIFGLAKDDELKAEALFKVTWSFAILIFKQNMQKLHF